MYSYVNSKMASFAAEYIEVNTTIQMLSADYECKHYDLVMGFFIKVGHYFPYVK